LRSSSHHTGGCVLLLAVLPEPCRWRPGLASTTGRHTAHIRRAGTCGLAQSPRAGEHLSRPIAMGGRIRFQPSFLFFDSTPVAKPFDLEEDTRGTRHDWAFR